MKPICQFEERGFPRTDCFFQAYSGGWHSWDDGEPFRRRQNVGREYLIEAARERTKEMLVLSILLIASTWPIILVMIEVARVYKSHR